MTNGQNMRAQTAASIVPEIQHVPPRRHQHQHQYEYEHEQQHQQQHTLTTGVNTPEARRYDRDYLTSISGIAKIACLVFDFLGILCILLSRISASNLRGSFYNIVAFFGLFCTSIALLGRVFHIWERHFTRCSHIRCEMFMHGSLAAFHFLASAFVLSLDTFSYTMAAFFGLLAFSLHAFEAFKHYRRSLQKEAATQTDTDFV